MYVYMRSEPELWTVGERRTPGTGSMGARRDWEPESDWPSEQEAAERVHWLNGGQPVDHGMAARLREIADGLDREMNGQPYEDPAGDMTLVIRRAAAKLDGSRP